MRARAPGKVVLSGAYSVLRGAPAIVTAVDRYVEADDGEPETRDSKAIQRQHPRTPDAELTYRSFHEPSACGPGGFWPTW